MVKQFLPYTSKGGLPSAPWMVSLYLHSPLTWLLLGGLMLLVARAEALIDGFWPFA